MIPTVNSLFNGEVHFSVNEQKWAKIRNHFDFWQDFKPKNLKLEQNYILQFSKTKLQD